MAAEGRDDVKTQKEDGHMQTQNKEASEEINLLSILTLDF